MNPFRTRPVLRDPAESYVGHAEIRLEQIGMIVPTHSTISNPANHGRWHHAPQDSVRPTPPPRSEKVVPSGNFTNSSPKGAESYSPGQAQRSPGLLAKKHPCPEGAASKNSLKLVPFDPEGTQAPTLEPRSSAGVVRNLPSLLAVVVGAALFLFPGIGGPSPVSAEETVRTGSYESFPLLRSRNIFDPNRTPRAAPTGPVTRTTPDYLRLTGTLISDGRYLAFFSGSREDFRQVVTLEESVGGLTVTGITQDHVEMTHGDQPVKLTIGSSYLIAEARLAGDDDLPQNSSGPTDSAGEEETSPTPSASGSAENPNESDVLRRMRERRQQEISR